MTQAKKKIENIKWPTPKELKNYKWVTLEVDMLKMTTAKLNEIIDYLNTK